MIEESRNIKDGYMKKNKILSLLLALSLVALGACHNQSAEEKHLISERDSLRLLNEHQQVVLNDMTFTIVEISNILDTINMQERILFSQYDEEGRRFTQHQLIKRIESFESFLQEKKERIHYLDSLVKKSDDRIKKLGTLISYMNSEINKKDSIIQNLKSVIESKNYNINTLNRQLVEAQSGMSLLSDSLSNLNKETQELDKQVTHFNTAFYVVGTKKELSNQGILVGGLFRKNKINYSAFTDSHKHDIRKLDYIDIFGNDPKILTPVVKGSYKIETLSKGHHKLHILDKKTFWNASKYLVVQVKK